ncbi:hypothetical protein BVRB_8g199670 [Beta vulgaris subsp. vulgaris]|uniref:Uncharacterized protein n=1 Tax=Beta vulgaris subsp. vulgaris TaxID=3555 RepID=A0A0J8B697_BETVV|nr:hypothetical protein BVRB_8g199670 [Beta vulgaris subsp. vulgaris]
MKNKALKWMQVTNDSNVHEVYISLRISCRLQKGTKML